jgi:hypothetical protein
LAIPRRKKKLIELGRQFEIVHARTVAANEAFNAIHNPIHDEALRLAGYSHNQLPKGPENWDKVMLHWKRLEERAGEPYQLAERESNDAYKPLDDLVRAINAIPATTMAGLVVKARVAKETGSINWNDERRGRELEWDEEPTVRLIDDLLRMAGQST